MSIKEANEHERQHDNRNKEDSIDSIKAGEEEKF